MEELIWIQMEWKCNLMGTKSDLSVGKTCGPSKTGTQGETSNCRICSQTDSISFHNGIRELAKDGITLDSRLDDKNKSCLIDTART